MSTDHNLSGNPADDLYFAPDHPDADQWRAEITAADPEEPAMTQPAATETEPTDTELTHDAAIFAARWYAQPNDLIGGWCVMVTNQPPSAGGTMVADFTTRAIAEHMAELHNRTFGDGDLDSLPGVPA